MRPLLAAVIGILAVGTACERVHLPRPTPLAVTKFLAFGDSITEGQNGDAPPGLCGQQMCVDIPNAYPTLLNALIGSAYPSQAVSMFNAGVGGEPAIGVGEARLQTVLTAQRPEVLLLLHGTNDIIGGQSPAAITQALRNMIRTAFASGVRFVFVSTLLPQRPGGTPPRGSAAAFVEPANVAIRPMILAEGATLVDAYAAFVGKETTHLANDGLHVTPLGNQTIAQLFFNAVHKLQTQN